MVNEASDPTFEHATIHEILFPTLKALECSDVTLFSLITFNSDAQQVTVVQSSGITMCVG